MNAKDVKKIAALTAILFPGPYARAETKPAVVSSTAGVKAYTVADLYGGTKYRDPFASLGSGSAALVAPVVYKPEDFSIHALNLRGLLHDRSGDYAVLVEPQSGYSFILRGGHLYDYRNKRVPGVTGTVQLRQKTVVLVNADNDVQTLRLGETEEDPKKPSP